MLDRYLRPSHHDDDDDRSLTYTRTGRAGGELGVGLVAAAPPGISYLLYHWSHARHPDESTSRRRRAAGGSSSSSSSQIDAFWEAKAVAVHRGAILLRCLFPIHTRTFPDKSEEFFVYLHDAPLPTLTKLPTCRRGHNFMNCRTADNAGILCRETGEFVAAHLTVRPEGGGGDGDYRVTAKLCRFLSESGSWCKTKIVPIICGDEAQREDFGFWQTDEVVTFGDFICWVDYLRGILFCDVLSPDPEIKYVTLPISSYPGTRHPFLHGTGVSAYRSLCVTKDGGSMKFVDVAPAEAWFHGRQEGVPRPPIKSWTLTDDRRWREDVMMEEDDFFALITDNKLPPRSGVECPLVHFRDPEIIYLKLGHEPHQSRLLEFNMKSRTMNVTSCEITSFGSSRMDSNTTSFSLCYNEQPLALSLDAPNMTNRRRADN